MDQIVSDAASLCRFLKKMIIDTLKLEGTAEEDIDSDAPLFKEGLGLDSIDALELVVAIEKIFGVVIEDEDVGKKAFASVNTLAAFVRENYRRESVSCAG